MRTRAELVRFVHTLPIPEERREVVLLELEDHLFSAMAEREAAGSPPAQAEAEALESLGLEALRHRLVVVNAGFAPVGPRAAAALGFRVGGSFAAAVVFAAFLLDATGNVLVTTFENAGIVWRPIALALAIALLLHAVATRPKLVARALVRIEDPVAFGAFWAAAALVSALPVQLGSWLARLRIPFPFDVDCLSYPIYGHAFLALWGAHAILLGFLADALRGSARRA